MVAFTEVICSLPLYPSTGGLGAADWWCLSSNLGLSTESGSCCFGCSGTGLHLWRIQCSPDLPLRRGQEWPWTPPSTSHCLKDKVRWAYQCDPVIGAGEGGSWKEKGRGTDLCLCVCKAVAGHSLLLVPYFTPLFIWELSGWALTAPSRPVVSFILFFILARWWITGQGKSSMRPPSLKSALFWRLIYWLLWMSETLFVTLQWS